MVANPPQVFVGGDGAAARESISSDKLKQSRFSLNSLIDSLPKFCKDEFCHGDMDETFSVSSHGSTENGLNSIQSVARDEEENVLDREGEYM